MSNGNKSFLGSAAEAYIGYRLVKGGLGCLGTILGLLALLVLLLLMHAR